MNNPVLENQIEDVIYALGTSPHFATDKTCYAARQSGLYKSCDAGLTWQSAFDSLNMPTQPSATAVAVAADGVLLVGVPGAILSSTDGGLTWMTTVLPTPSPFITMIAVSPNYQHDGVAFAGSMEDGIFVTEDHGKSWNAWNFGLLDQNIFCIAISPNFSHDQRVYTGTESGIFISENCGHSWRVLNSPDDFAPVLSLALSPAYSSDSLIWAGSESNGLFCSEDHGLSWKQRGALGSANNIILSLNFPNKPDILMLLDDQLLISRNGGNSWVALSDSSRSQTGFMLVVAPFGLDAGSAVLLSSDEGDISTTVLT